MNEADLNEACSEIAAHGSPVVRDYSHSPSDCLDLIAAMLRKGYRLIASEPDGLFQAAFVGCLTEELDARCSLGETLQLAVCRAAVAAMEGK